MPPIVRSDGSIPTRSEKGRATAIFNRLRKRYPDIHTALTYENPWQLLVVTVLSAQTTDENVNRTAPALFARYPTPQALAEADPEEVERLVYSTGFYRQKTESIIALSVDLVERHRGEVPASLDELVPLRGVGRKTASVVLAEAFGQPAIAVDTHVRRVSNRLGLTNGQNPLKIEQDLKAVFPRSNWSKLSMSIIQFGRDVCTARSPRCPECELARLCPWPYKTGPDTPGPDTPGLDDAGLDDAGLDDAGLDDAGLDDAGLDDADPDNADPDNADPDNADPDNADPDNADPDNADPDNADPDTPGQNNAGMTPPTEAAPAG